MARTLHASMPLLLIVAAVCKSWLLCGLAGGSLQSLIVCSLAFAAMLLVVAITVSLQESPDFTPGPEDAISAAAANDEYPRLVG